MFEHGKMYLVRTNHDHKRIKEIYELKLCFSKFFLLPKIRDIFIKIPWIKVEGHL
jgi:hypothetical protein